MCLIFPTFAMSQIVISPKTLPAANFRPSLEKANEKNGKSLTDYLGQLFTAYVPKSNRVNAVRSILVHRCQSMRIGREHREEVPEHVRAEDLTAGDNVP